MAFERELNRYLLHIRLEKGLSQNSIEAYSHDLNRYIVYISKTRGIIDLRGIAVHHIEDYLEELAAVGLSPSSMARNISSVRNFHAFCTGEGFTEANAAEIIELPKKARTLPQVLDVEEIMRMIELHDPETPDGARARAILELLYGTGMRVSELCALTTDRLLFEIGYIRVIGKGDKERIIPVGQYAVHAVEHWLTTARPVMLKTATAAKGAVFLNRRGTPLSRMSVWSLVHESAQKAAIGKEAYPHIFRHSCATHMLEGGADLKSVQEMLGHASILTTEIYTHVDRSLMLQTHKMYHPRA